MRGDAEVAFLRGSLWAVPGFSGSALVGLLPPAWRPCLPHPQHCIHEGGCQACLVKCHTSLPTTVLGKER